MDQKLKRYKKLCTLVLPGVDKISKLPHHIFGKIITEISKKSRVNKVERVTNIFEPLKDEEEFKNNCAEIAVIAGYNVRAAIDPNNT